MSTKICKDCLKEQPLDNYYKASLRSHTRDGLRHECKKCNKTYQKNRYEKYKDQYVLLNRKSHFKCKYGLTIGQVEQMKKEQNYKCLICRKQPETLCVDHVKDTKIVRGLLCAKCNQGIGSLNHNIDDLKEAIKYLENSNEKLYDNSNTETSSNAYS